MTFSKTITGISTASLACAACLAAATARGETPTFFRRDGGVAATEKPLPADLGEKDALLWRREFPPGNSTPCLCGDRIFLTTFRKDEKQLDTLALDRQTGRVRWKRTAPTKTLERFHPVGSPASCTPACDGERVYVFFGSYGMLCYDTGGELLWSHELGPFQDEFGASSSPVLAGGKVILNEDHDVGSFLIALDAATGETLWKTPRKGFTRSYSTPVVWEAGGKTQLVVAGALQLTAYDIDTGKKLWWVRGLSRIVDTTPAIADGLLYVATWTPGGDQTNRISMGPFAAAAKKYDANEDGKIARDELPEGPVLQRFFRIDLDQDGKLDEAEWNKHARVFELAQNVAIAVRPGGEGDVTQTHVKWVHRRGLPVVPSPLVYRGVVYLVKDSGIVTLLDAETGEQLGQARAAGRGNYYASPVAGDGKVYFASERGVVTVAEAGRAWQELSAHDFAERIMATPVIADGRIYLRTDKALYAFGAR